MAEISEIQGKKGHIPLYLNNLNNHTFLAFYAFGMLYLQRICTSNHELQIKIQTHVQSRVICTKVQTF